MIPNTHPKTKELFETITKKYEPNAKIVFKSQSKLMKLIEKITWLFNKYFMTDYITTIGKTIYVPDDFWDGQDNNCFETIAHETIHILQYKKNKRTFYLDYLSPQINIIWSFLAFVNLYFLFFLIFLFPLPSKSRIAIEKEGYAMSISVRYWLYGKGALTDMYLNDIKEQFTSSAYYFMCWDKYYVNNMINNIIYNLESNLSASIDKLIFKDVYELIQKHKKL